MTRESHFLNIASLLRQEKFEVAMTEIETALENFGVDDGLLDAALAVRATVGPYRRPGASSVSLCMIVKDEALHLVRCLRSAKPIVDEIVVVDTGSTDRSSDIARVFGARVYEHPWRHDFSEARNVSIARATGNWILVLDADEALAPQDYESFLKVVAGERTSAYTVRTRNYTAEVNTVGWRPNSGDYPQLEAGVGWFPSEKVRLFPRRPGVVFSGAVHELVEPSLRVAGIPLRTCGLQVHHYGKLKEDRAGRKTRTYSELERRKLQTADDRSASLREAAVQATRLGRPAEAIALWRQFLESYPESAEAYVNLSAAWMQMGRYDEAARSAEAASRAMPSMREAYVNLALAAVHRGDAARAVAVLEPLLVRDPGYLHARFLLAASYACQGDSKKSAATLKPIETTALGAVLPVSFRELAQSLEGASQKAYGQRVREATPLSRLAGSTLKTLMTP
jgi:Flp pilus assembly protein TadD